MRLLLYRMHIEPEAAKRFHGCQDIGIILCNQLMRESDGIALVASN